MSVEILFFANKHIYAIVFNGCFGTSLRFGIIIECIKYLCTFHKFQLLLHTIFVNI